MYVRSKQHLKGHLIYNSISTEFFHNIIFSSLSLENNENELKVCKINSVVVVHNSSSYDKLTATVNRDKSHDEYC